MNLHQIKIKMNLSLFLIFSTFVLVSCKKANEIVNESVQSLGSNKFLYISSGQCNSGAGITTFSSTNSSRLLSKVHLSTKIMSPVLDLAAPFQAGSFAPETSIQSVLDQGSNLFILTENAINMGERKIYSVPKLSPFNASVYSNDVLALTQNSGHILRTMDQDADGSLILSKSVGLEKIGSNRLRIPMGSNAWVNAPGGGCATSTSFMSALKILPPYLGSTNGKIIFAHQGSAAASNRLGIVSSNGYAVVSDCLNGFQLTSVAHTNAPNVTGPLTFNATNGVSPTAFVYIPPTGPVTKASLIVSYSSAVATDLNNSVHLVFAIVKWTINETSASVATLSSPVVLYNNFTNIFGISAMTYDASDSSLYVATASQVGVSNQTTAGYGYKIEKFFLDLEAPSLTLIRTNNLPFIDRSSATKCITSLAVGTESN